MFNTFKRSMANLRYPILVVVGIWLKTYAITKIAFDLSIESSLIISIIKQLKGKRLMLSLL